MNAPRLIDAVTACSDIEIYLAAFCMVLLIALGVIVGVMRARFGAPEYTRRRLDWRPLWRVPAPPLKQVKHRLGITPAESVAIALAPLVREHGFQVDQHAFEIYLRPASGSNAIQLLWCDSEAEATRVAALLRGDGSPKSRRNPA